MESICTSVKTIHEAKYDFQYVSISHQANSSLGWQNNQTDVIKFIEENITPRRLYEEYRQEIRRRVAMLRRAVDTVILPRYRRFFPRLRDFVALPEVRAMIDPFKTIQFDHQSIDHLVSIVDGLLVTWTAECTQQMEEVFRSKCPDLPEDVTVLDLAIANVTKCRSGFCHVFFCEPWPNSVIHECRWTGMFRSCEREKLPHTKEPDQWYDITMIEHLDFKWSKTDLQSFTRGIKIILELCGKDPLRTTAAEMDESNLRFVCTYIQKNAMECRKILKWREAVSIRFS